jgi:hypothetical protein
MERLGKLVKWGSFALLLGTVGCGGLEATKPLTTCDSGAAAIGITDGQLARLCGCTEPGGQWVATNSNLTCTVKVGTVVVFHYINPINRHQIVSAPASALSFTPSGIFNREMSPPVLAHAVKLETVGVYDFTDNFDSSLKAQIIVVP